MVLKRLFRAIFVVYVLSSFSYSQDKITIFMVGDSTMANKPLEDNPERGWGQILPEFFDNNISIDNHAKNGRSSRSFIYEGRWDSVMNMVRKGDYIIIQFGHNDGVKEKTDRYCTPVEYRYNIKKFIKDARSKGASPVLCTSIQRRKFDETGSFQDTHGEYPAIIREIAAELKVPLIDMQQKSEEVIIQYGVEGSKKLFLHIKPGEFKTLPEGKEDNTHFSEYGARIMAGLFCDGLREINHELANYLIK
jgi:DNA sulfur modification protein DndE